MLRFGHHPGDVEPDTVTEPAAVSTGTLRDLAGDPGCQRPLLLDQHLLILVTVGHGSQEVDFRTYQVRPGSLIWAQPGQVVRFSGQPSLDAVLVTWGPHALAGLGPAQESAARFGLGYWQLAGEDEDAVINEVSQLVVDCQRHRRGDRATDLLRHQLAVLLLRLALLPSGDGGPPTGNGTAADRGAAPTFQRLWQKVERSYGHTRRVEDYAELMGCSVRTLTRACLAATGRSAKQVIDDRVALQAMRLLAATREPVADIGRRLGFPEPTNFGRFFQREVGQSPGAFRATQGRPSTAASEAAPRTSALARPGRRA